MKYTVREAVTRRILGPQCGPQYKTLFSDLCEPKDQEPLKCNVKVRAHVPRYQRSGQDMGQKPGRQIDRQAKPKEMTRKTRIGSQVLAEN